MFLFVFGSALCLAEGSMDEPGEEIRRADTELIGNYRTLVEEYRVKLAKPVSKADRVELFLLGSEEMASGCNQTGDPFNEESSKEWFKIAPYNHSVPILARKTAPPEKLADLVLKISDMLERPGDTLAGCHKPIHGVRVFSGEELLFETSLCYSCRNFYINTPISAMWVPLPENGIKNLLMELMPVPPENPKKGD